MPKAVFINYNLLGDSLMTTPAIREFKKTYDYDIVLVCNDAQFQRMLLGNPYVKDFLFVSDEDKKKIIGNMSPKFEGLKDFERILYDTGVEGKLWERPNGDLFCILDAGVAYGYCASKASIGIKKINNEKIPVIKKPSLTDGFANQLGVTLSSRHYDMVIDSSDERAASDYLSNHSKPVILCAALSSSCTSRHHLAHPGEKPLGYANKMIDAKIWNKVIESLSDDYDFVFLKAKGEPEIEVSNVPWLEGLPMKTIAAMCKQAYCTVSIDTGISHVCAAVDGPMVLMTAAVESGLTVPETSAPLFLIDHSVSSERLDRGIVNVTPEEIMEGIKSIGG